MHCVRFQTTRSSPENRSTPSKSRDSCLDLQGGSPAWSNFAEEYSSELIAIACVEKATHHIGPACAFCSDHAQFSVSRSHHFTVPSSPADTNVFAFSCTAHTPPECPCNTTPKVVSFSLHTVTSDHFRTDWRHSGMHRLLPAKGMHRCHLLTRNSLEHVTSPSVRSRALRSRDLLQRSKNTLISIQILMRRM